MVVRVREPGTRAEGPAFGGRPALAPPSWRGQAMGMKVAALLALAWLAAPGFAAVRGAPARGAAPGFVPRYLGSLSLSLRGDPLFAGRLLASFDKHLGAVAPLPGAREVGGYLQAQVAPAAEGPAARADAARLSAGLGQEPIEADPAAALLLANGLMRPEQFREALEGLEGLREGWGQRVAWQLKRAGEKGVRHAEFRRLLEELGARFMPPPANPTYDARGRLVGAYDGGR